MWKYSRAGGSQAPGARVPASRFWLRSNTFNELGHWVVVGEPWTLLPDSTNSRRLAGSASGGSVPAGGGTATSGGAASYPRSETYPLCGTVLTYL